MSILNTSTQRLQRYKHESQPLEMEKRPFAISNILVTTSTRFTVSPCNTIHYALTLLSFNPPIACKRVLRLKTFATFYPILLCKMNNAKQLVHVLFSFAMKLVVLRVHGIIT